MMKTWVKELMLVASHLVPQGRRARIPSAAVTALCGAGYEGTDDMLDEEDISYVGEHIATSYKPVTEYDQARSCQDRILGARGFSMHASCVAQLLREA